MTSEANVANWPDCNKRVQCCDILQAEEKF